MKNLITLIIVNLTFLAAQAQVKWEGRKQPVDSLVSKGINYIRQNEEGKAIELSRAVLHQFPRYSDFNYIQALAYQKLERYDLATYFFQKVISESANYLDAYFGLAQLKWKQGRYSEADQVWQTIPDSLINKPYSKELFLEYQRLTEADRQENQIITLLDNYRSDPDRYQDQLDALAKAQPERTDLLEVQISKLIEQKKYAEADQKINLLLAKGIDVEENQFRLANLYAQNKEYNKAFEIMDSLKNKYPENMRYKKIRNVYNDLSTYHYYVGIDQSFITFDRPVNTYTISGLTLGAKLNKGISLSGQVNYARLKNGNGFQYNLDSWINYSPSIYSYASVGYSNSQVFPAWRLAYTLYKEFPGWLVDIGARYMKPQLADGTLSGVLSAGKYFGSNFFYLRSFWSKMDDRFEKSFILSWRYYYNEEKPETYFTILGNIGTSPDDPDRYDYYINPAGFKSYGASMGIQHRIGKQVLGAMGSWSNYKITDDNFLNQFTLNLSLKHYF